MKKHPANPISKKRVLRKKVKPMSSTGAELPFWISEERSYRCPRKKKKYQNLKVRELLLRIRNDLEELISRAASNRESLNAALELASSNGDIEWKEGLKEAIQGLEDNEPKLAADAVAFLGQLVAKELENLAYSRKPMMKEIAKKFSEWPVNLTLNKKRNLERVAFAKGYLKGLDVNSESRWPAHRIDSSPYQAAAKKLYQRLLMMKDDYIVLRKRKTQWEKCLLALPAPMTKRKFPDWWRVARVYLIEQWKMDQSAFDPLISCTKANHSCPSEHRRNVIDLNLKPAFKTLAV